jgi:hypothetical protein
MCASALFLCFCSAFRNNAHIHKYTQNPVRYTTASNNTFYRERNKISINQTLLSYMYVHFILGWGRRFWPNENWKISEKCWSEWIQIDTPYCSFFFAFYSFIMTFFYDAEKLILIITDMEKIIIWICRTVDLFTIVLWWFWFYLFFSLFSWLE